jgi:predicted aspartyl protease
MMQIEYEKSLRLLNDVNTQMTLLKKINHHTDANVVSAGSLIYTNQGAIFIAISLGKIKIENHDVMVISPQSPLALKLMQAKKLSTISMNSIEYIIEKVE